MRGPLVRVAALWALVGTAGCSYMWIDRPPRAVRRGDRFPGCTTSKTLPWLDVGLAVFAAIGLGAIVTGQATTTDGNDNDPDAPRRELTTREKITFGSITGIEGVLIAFSAMYGFETTAQCRDIQGRLGMQPMQPMQPMPVQGPPGGAQ